MNVKYLEDLYGRYGLSLSKVLLSFVFCAIVAGRLIHLNPALPSLGLDPSWALGMNTAIERGMAIGKDIVFTYGPLPYLETPYIIPDRYYFSLSLNLFILIFTSILFIRSSVLERPILNIIILISLFFISISNNIFYFYSFLVFSHSALLRNKRSLDSFIFSLSFIPLSLMPIIKGSYLVPSAFFAIISILYIISYGRYRLSILAASVYFLSFLVFWKISSQPLDGLPSYLKTMLPLISGYTEAMAVYGPPWHLVLFGISAASIVVSVAWPLLHRDKPSEMWRTILWTAAVAGFLFLQFKIGFVRHDGHVWIAAGSLLLAVTVLPVQRSAATRNPALLLSLIVFACVSAYLIQGNRPEQGPLQRLEANLAPVRSLIRGFRNLPPSQAVLNRRYEDALARIHKQDPIPKFPGTTDIYSFNQAALIASGNIWDPRPVFQSYAAYEPALAKLNRDHLLGANAPDNILFAVEPIDGRLPTLEDGLSWPSLMSHYRLVDYVGKYAHLRRRASPTPDVMGEERHSEYHALGEVFSLPDPKASILFATVEIEPTLLGRALGILFKPTQLHMNLSLANGQTHAYRIVSSMTKSGFVLSPMVRSTVEFADLISGNQSALDGTRVTSAKIWSDVPWLPIWKPTVKITYAPLTPEQYQEPDSLFSPTLEGSQGATTISANCLGVIDKMNGQLLGGKRTAPSQRHLTLNGWLISLDKNMDNVPSQVLVEVAYDDGRKSFYTAQRTNRHDVNAHFKRPDLPDVGYEARIDLPAGTRNYTVTVGAKGKDVLALCRNLTVRAQP